jgi:transcriptional regulator with XRE-family HTH domain
VLNERIKELRVARGLSQVELAEKIGISKQSVSNWENDNIQPSIEMLIKIARTFSVSTDYLLGEDERTFLEVSHLSQKQISHIQQIIDDISGKSDSV